MSHYQHINMHVARGEDGRKLLALHKRDDYSDNIHNFIHVPSHNTNSENIKLNVPAGFPPADSDKDVSNSNNSGSDDSGVETVVSMVYVTMSPSFSGSVPGYTTATPAMSSAAATTSALALSSAAVSSQAVVATPAVGTPQAQSRESATAMVGTPQAQSRESSSPSASSQADSNMTISQSSNGLTDGAKAGLAIGIILAIALAAGLIFFCWRRSKKDTNREELNEKQPEVSEKRSSFFGATAAAPAAATNNRYSADSDKSFGTAPSQQTATAPRLSLRPVTQFLPSFAEKRKSSVNALAGTTATQNKSAWERPQTASQNPFSDAAVLSEKQAQPSNPFEEGDGTLSKTPSVKSNGSGKHSQKSSWEGTEPPTPKSLHFGTAAAVPVSAMNAQSSSVPPVPSGPNNVHRVQLDFKPSMDDELELKSGQLVRMLHEYDDGWALCIRMDRSQQGVAPRTCLSKTPVKPRGPPSGGRHSPPGMRGPPPQGAMSPRPLTPTGQQQSQDESQRSSTGVPARKPVPGQAM